MQTLLMVLLFVGAIVFIGRKIYRDFTAKNSCASGCAKCDIANKVPSGTTSN